MIRIKPNIINSIDVSNYYKIFRYVCYKKQFKVAKWLLSLKPDINISYNNEEVFRYACCHGNLDIAKWLYRVKPDINISSNNNEAFYGACYNGHLGVGKWLQSLKPYLYVIIYEGIFYDYWVRRKEDANREKRKYALHLALQEQTNILYHLPVDIAKAVTLFV